MKLKTIEVNGQTYAAVQDGNPVYVYDDGKESSIDVADMADRFSTLQADAKKAFSARDEAKKALAAFDGLDPEKAREAVAKIGNLDLKKLVDAGQVDAAVAAAIKPVQEKYDAEAKRAATLEAQLHSEIVGGSFARSKYVTDKLAVPSDMVQAMFGARFAVKDGKLVATLPDGSPIYSRSVPGQTADFDEALETLVAAYPHKESILRADNKPGSGAPTNGAPSSRARSTISRAAFDALDPQSRMEHVQAGGQVN